MLIITDRSLESVIIGCLLVEPGWWDKGTPIVPDRRAATASSAQVGAIVVRANLPPPGGHGNPDQDHQRLRSKRFSPGARGYVRKSASAPVGLVEQSTGQPTLAGHRPVGNRFSLQAVHLRTWEAIPNPGARWWTVRS